MTATDAPPSPEKFRWILNEFVKNVRGLTDAVICSADGLLLVASDSVAERGDIAEVCAAATVSVWGFAKNAPRLFQKGECEQIILRLEHGSLVITMLSDGAGICVALDAECDMKLAIYELTRFAESYGHVLTPEFRVQLNAAAIGAKR